MARPRTIDYDRVVAVFAEVGTVRETARILGIHEQSAFKILKRSRGACIDCGKPAKLGKNRCQDCANKANAAQRAAQQAHVDQGLCALCPEPLGPSSRRFCIRHKGNSLRSTREYRQRRIVHLQGEALEEEKTGRLRKQYGEGAVTAWKRDKGCCILCDVSYENRTILIHHLDRDRKHNTADNLVCLCYTCHRLVHALSEHPHITRFLGWFLDHYPDNDLVAHFRQGQRPARRQPHAETTLTFDFAGS